MREATVVTNDQSLDVGKTAGPTLTPGGRLRVDGAGSSPSSPSYVQPTAASTASGAGSGSITTGGTAQQLVAANAARKGLSVENTSSGDLFINELATAAATGASIKIPSGQEYVFSPMFGYVPVSAISIFGATTGQTFVVREW